MLGSRPVYIFLWIIIGLITFKAGGMFIELYQLRSQAQLAQLRVERLEEQRQEFEGKINSVDDGMEREIRTNFNVKRSGEQTVVIIEEEGGEDSGEGKKGFFGRIKSAFGF